ncbi:MAG: T9SS C-terminal target domain-containing protein [Bacteroidetes bacterium]|nr:MAG: T9SS C-terminal target domain-containing protein [Bacteroidota bacterium]REK04737.1 MAG: T9SS C-terminal target domain-containing protein [Bacteroidota bacterium]REK36211.1 MAG: T9SS C-terminal target domain-containing protein [Bacteroidota bacterium]REK51418.1 MAG: T9SS C-terminal target domain-containing protein [Bacteroidota bacterium]
MKIIKTLLFFILTGNISTGQVFNVDTVLYNGDPNNRINLIIMGDGYTNAEMSQFRTDARTVSNYLFSIPPFLQYQEFFNVFAIEVVSNESGTDHPATASDEGSYSVPFSSVDNYLQTTFDYGGTHRCLFSSQSALIYSIANTNFPMWDYLNVIVNTSHYGGCASSIAYTSMHSASPEIFVHELGHMFGNLADEYDYGGSNCNAGTSQNINVSQQTDTSLLVWKNWLSTAPIPTPAGTNCGLIGLYEGARYCTSNWYRPKCNCKMRSLNQPFCEVCTEQFIYKISTLVNYIESYSPSNTTTISVCQNSSLNFNSDILNNTTGTVRVQWLVDNNVVLTNSSAFTLNPSQLNPGPHQIKLIAYDTTVSARRTLTSRQVTWTVNVIAAPVAQASANNTVFCTGQTLNLSANGNGTFSWTGPSGFSQNSQNPSISNITVSRSGTYTVTVTNSCGSSASSVNISVSPPLSAAINPLGPLTFCAGSGVILETAYSSDYSYQWLRNGVSFPAPDTSRVFTGQSGSYTVTITLKGTTCTATSSPVNVNVNPLPSAVISTSDPLIFCNGNSALLSANPVAGTSYQWFRNNTIVTGATSSQLNVSSQGNYHVVVSLNACSDTSSSLTVTVNPLPASNVTVQGSNIFCDGDSVLVNVPPCNSCTYVWSVGAVPISGATMSSVYATQSGNYEVTVSDTSTGCISSGTSITINVLNVPSASVTASGPLTFCEGDSLTLQANSGYTYIWYRNSGIIPGANTNQIIVRQGGSYQVNVSNGFCSVLSNNFLVNVNSRPVVSMSALPDTLCVNSMPVPLNGIPSGGSFSGNGVLAANFDPGLAGTGTQIISYSYSDVNACVGIATDSIFVDLCMGLSVPSLNEPEFIIYPNPASGKVEVRFRSNVPEWIAFTLLDVSGRAVKNIRPAFYNQGEHRLEFILENYAGGVYILEMKTSAKNLRQRLMIRN